MSVSNATLALAVHEECCAWTRALAAAMRELDAAAVAGLRARMRDNAEALQAQPEDLEQLKGVLQVIASIRCARGLAGCRDARSACCCSALWGCCADANACSHRQRDACLLLPPPLPSTHARSSGMQMELTCVDLQERFRTRALYAISDAERAAGAAELDDACRLDAEWAALCAAAEAADARLAGVKRRFASATRQQVTAFAAATAELAEHLRTAGPGLPGVALPAGLEALRCLQAEVAALGVTREALRQAELLFGLEVTAYPHLAAVRCWRAGLLGQGWRMSLACAALHAPAQHALAAGKHACMH